MPLTDFSDQTPNPDPAPKKHYVYSSFNGASPIPWPTGQTFQQALGAALPAAIRNRTNLTDFVINITLDVREV